MQEDDSKASAHEVKPVSDPGEGATPVRKKAKSNRKFPLFRHATGQWAKKVRGKTHYFGTAKQAAYDEWMRVRDALLGGRPRESVDPIRQSQPDSIALRELCNQFLESRKGKVGRRKLTLRSWADYVSECERLCSILGPGTIVDHLRERDFARLLDELSKPVARKGKKAKKAKKQIREISQKTMEGRIVRCRAVFRFGEKRKVIAPILHKMEDEFQRPSKRDIRKDQGSEKKLFEAAEIRLLLEHANVRMRAAILLGINAAYGPSDVANLTFEDVLREPGWLSESRAKTGKDRRCHLWPETTQALQSMRAAAKGGKDQRVFLTASGEPLNGSMVHKSRTYPNGEPVAYSKVNPLSREFRKLCDSVGIKSKKKTFYALRHTFKTIGLNATLNNFAVDLIMGHLEDSVKATYLQTITDERLREVTDAVRSWLFPPADEPKAAE